MGGIFASRGIGSPTGSGAECRELLVRGRGLLVFLTRQIFEDGLRAAVEMAGGIPEHGRRLAARILGNLPGLREGDLLLKCVSGGAAFRALVRQRLRVRRVPAHVTVDLR